MWGFRTWRGVTEQLPRVIPAAATREWRILIEPGTKLGPSTTNYWEAPAVDPYTSEPKFSTQLPEGLKGCKDSTWPYPWGKEGTQRRLGLKGPIAVRALAESKQQAAAVAPSAAEPTQQEAEKQ